MFSLVLIGTFLTVVLLIIGIYSLFFSSKIETLSRLEKYTAEENTQTGVQKEKENDEKNHIFKLLGVLGRILPKSKYLEKKKKKLVQAAVLMKPEEFLGISFICAAAMSLLVYLLIKITIIALVFLPVGFIIPELIIGIKKSKRMGKINSELPEALNIISNGLRAGFSFNQALATVITEISGPISEEFKKVLRDNSLGKPLEEALTNMSERTDDEDLDMVITALIIQRQVGGNLAEILDTISHTIRERIRIKSEIKTLTAQGRISGGIVSLLPIALALALSVISPGYLTVLFTTFIGKFMVVIGVVMQLIGIFILTRLVDIKV